MEDKREIVSFRIGNVAIYGKVKREDGSCFWLDDGTESGYCVGKYRKCLTHRNLAAIPHKDFGRECKVGGQDVGIFLGKKRGDCEYPYVADIFEDPEAQFSVVTFLDEQPDIEITVKIGGKTSTLSDISKETLLKIREQDKP